MGSGEQDVEVGQDGEAEDPDSQKALLNKKEKRELKKINAAKEKAHKKFEALLNIGTGTDDGSEKQSPKKRQRTKTAEGASSRSKQTPPKPERKQSEESLLKDEEGEDDEVVGDDGGGNVESSEVKTTRKKKKKKKAATIQHGADNEGFEDNDDEKDIEEDESVATAQYDEDDNEDTAANDGNEGGRRQASKIRKKKKKKTEIEMKEYVEKALKKRDDDGLLLCIIIHKADQVKPDARVRHPLIRIHLVDMESGNYIKKTDSTRKVTSMFEKKNAEDDVDYILPLLTQPYDFKTNRTLTPYWDETMVYNEVYSYFLQREIGDPSVIIFFELVDFLQMNVKPKESATTDKGWYRVAWAFLKIISPSGCTNTDHQVRLQFYQPVKRLRVPKEEMSSVDIYRWWKYGSRVKYPSTLYVTVKGVYPPDDLQVTNRSMFPTQQERGTVSFEELYHSMDETVGQSETEEATQLLWSRLPGQLNKIPNQLHLALPTAQKGCAVVKFSPNGRYLACACVSTDGFPIPVFDFPEGNLVAKLDNHFGIVYDLCWSSNGKELLSASADTTVRCWDTKRFSSTPVKQFSHPCFVYACAYHPLLQSIVVTGGFDYVIRLWSKISDSLQAILLRELNQHKGYVNSLAFSHDGVRLYSADSVGVILEWSCPVEKKKKKTSDLGEAVNRWNLTNTLQLPELKNSTLSTIHVHPGDCKLLVHSRDSMLRMVDLRSFGITKTYNGGVNFKEHIHSGMSACGSFVFCGTEYGVVHVWSTETGNLVHSYKDLEYTKAVSYIHFHPHDHFVAFCSYGEGRPVAVYGYDPQVNIEKEKQQQKDLSPMQRTAMTADNTSEMLRSIQTTTTMMDPQPRTPQNNATTLMDTDTEERTLRKTLMDTDAERVARATEKMLSVTGQSTRNHVTFKETPRYDSGSGSATEAAPMNDTLLSTWGSDFTYTNPVDATGLSTGNRTTSGAQPKSSSTPLKHGNLKHQDDRDSTLTMSQLNVTDNRTGRQRKPRKVIGLYSYHPTQTNQLAFEANDVITVVGRGNADWGLGRLKDGRQGYFPRTYVMEYEGGTDQEDNVSRGSKSEGDVSVQYSAAVDRHGDLKFVSGNEDSDSDMSRSYRKRKQRRDRMQQRRTDGNPTA